MANIVASDVTYSITERRRLNSAPGRFFTTAKLTFPNTNTTYAGVGVPLTPASLGMPGKQLVDLAVTGQITGQAAGTAEINWTYDATNQTLRGYQTGTAVSTPLAELVAGTATLSVNSQVITVEAIGY